MRDAPSSSDSSRCLHSTSYLEDISSLDYICFIKPRSAIGSRSNPTADESVPHSTDMPTEAALSQAELGEALL